MAAGKSGKADPFKVKKTKTTTTQQSDSVEAPEEVREAIEAFRECQEQAKHFEGEATMHKDVVMSYAREEYSKRALNGQEGSFKIMGDETMVSYVMNSSAGLAKKMLRHSKSAGRRRSFRIDRENCSIDLMQSSRSQLRSCGGGPPIYEAETGRGALDH